MDIEKHTKATEVNYDGFIFSILSALNFPLAITFYLMVPERSNEPMGHILIGLLILASILLSFTIIVSTFVTGMIGLLLTLRKTDETQARINLIGSFLSSCALVGAAVLSHLFISRIIRWNGN